MQHWEDGVSLIGKKVAEECFLCFAPPFHQHFSKVPSSFQATSSKASFPSTLYLPLLKCFMQLKMTSEVPHSTDFPPASLISFYATFSGSVFLPNLKTLGLFSALSALYILFLSTTTAPTPIFSSFPVTLKKYKCISSLYFPP